MTALPHEVVSRAFHRIERAEHGVPTVRDTVGPDAEDRDTGTVARVAERCAPAVEHGKVADVHGRQVRSEELGVHERPVRRRESSVVGPQGFKRQHDAPEVGQRPRRGPVDRRGVLGQDGRTRAASCRQEALEARHVSILLPTGAAGVSV
jgi:hypothetical protein